MDFVTPAISVNFANMNQSINYSEFMSKLCLAVEQRLERKMNSPRDFDSLSDELSKAGSRISASTLKRIWGYNRDISTTYRPYKYTLVALVNFLGYRDIDDFDRNYDREQIQSAEFSGDTVLAEEIAVGSIVELSWAPDRVCKLVCMKNGVFKVVYSERGRLRAGDEVKFLSLTQNAPLFFNEVVRANSDETFVYTAGQRTGIRYRIRGIINTGEDSIIS